MNRPSPSEVFTPRNPNINPDMYVSRRELERKLRRAVEGTQHIIVFGDSGSGKTWLYKKIFSETNSAFQLIDLSIALTEGLSAAFTKSLPRAEWIAKKRKVKGEAGAQFWVAKVGAEGEIEYEAEEVRPIDAVLENLAGKDGDRRFIVFDNFEQVSTNADLLRDISSLVIRLDNPDFARHRVRFLFVGVVADMKELIAHYDNAGTVANRVAEIPEVQNLTQDEAEKLVKRGLFERLRIKFDLEEDLLIKRVLFLTDRNAQQLHELCYEIACEAQDNNWVLRSEGLSAAERDWADTSLSHYRALIESRMNKRETKIQRRNQVIFCLGLLDRPAIKATEVNTMVRKLFPDTVQATQLGIDQILASLADGSNPLLIRNPNESSYRLAHPKLRLAIRVRLEELAPENKSRKTLDELLEELIAELEAIQPTVDDHEI